MMKAHQTISSTLLVALLLLIGCDSGGNDESDIEGTYSAGLGNGQTLPIDVLFPGDNSPVGLRQAALTLQNGACTFTFTLIQNFGQRDEERVERGEYFLNGSSLRVVTQGLEGSGTILGDGRITIRFTDNFYNETYTITYQKN